MSLSNYFMINLPYGIERMEGTNRWVAFNREYLPLGSTFDTVGKQVSTYTEYKETSEEVLLKIATLDDCTFFKKNVKSGVINKVWFYNDATNPFNGQSITDRKILWDRYIKILEILSEFTIGSSINPVLDPRQAILELKVSFNDLPKTIDNSYYDPGNRAISAAVFGQWQVDKYGNMDFNNGEYVIEHDRVSEEDWIAHLFTKQWNNWNDFIPAYFQALKNKGVQNISIITFY